MTQTTQTEYDRALAAMLAWTPEDEALTSLHAALAAAKTVWESEWAKVEPLCWVRLLNGKVDWSEDCFGEKDHVIDSYEDSEGETYTQSPIYTTPPPSPQQINEPCSSKAVEHAPRSGDAGSTPATVLPSPQQAADTRTANLESLARFGPQQAHATTDAAQGADEYGIPDVAPFELVAHGRWKNDQEIELCAASDPGVFGVYIAVPAEQQAASEWRTVTDAELVEECLWMMDRGDPGDRIYAAAIRRTLASTIPAGDEGMRRDAA